MSISGDMSPKSPRWLEEDVEILRQLGYTVASDSAERDNYAQEIDEVGLEFLRLCLTDHDRALEEIPEYFSRLGKINRQVGVLSRLTSDQFGLIVNLASMNYVSLDEGRTHFLHRQIGEFLGTKNSMNIGGYTASLRNPELLRDLVVHWERLNWPWFGEYIEFLKDNSWADVEQQMAMSENNPILFALAVPLSTSDPLTQLRFRETYPELSGQGIDTIAARLYNMGAHHEILREGMPTMAYRYKDWETTIYEGLEPYADGYRGDILESIVAARWQVFDDTDLSFQSIITKMQQTAFSLDGNERLVRVER